MTFCTSTISKRTASRISFSVSGWKRWIVALVVVACFLPAAAQDEVSGLTDITFNPTDLGFNSGQGADERVNAIARLSDGRYLAAGTFTTYNKYPASMLVCLKANGLKDMSFDVGDGPGTGEILCLAVQSDGKILVGGNFSSFNNVAVGNIVRLNADGSVDGSFSAGNGFDGPVRSIALQTDGKMIVGGDFDFYNTTSAGNFARLNTNGSLDNTLDTQVGANGAVNAIGIQSDGKIVLGGEFTTYNSDAAGRIIRINSDGTPDAGFDPGSGFNGTVFALTFDNIGRVVVGGAFTRLNGNVQENLVRLGTDGVFDPSFALIGYPDLTVFSVAVQADNKVVVAGAFTQIGAAPNPVILRNRIARFDNTGNIDGTFNVGSAANGNVQVALPAADGTIIIGGQFTSFNGAARNHIHRLTSNGSSDLAFNPPTGANGSVLTLSANADGSLIAGGNFNSYFGLANSQFLVKFSKDGVRDGSFNSGGAGPNSSVNVTAVLSSGKVLAGGLFTTYNGTSKPYFLQLNANGTLDAAFNNGGAGPNLPVFSVATYTDGHILIGGAFSTYNGSGQPTIARLNADGSLDGSFAIGTGANAPITAMAIQSDGKILIGGPFTSFNGTAVNGIARLNSNGSIDNSFQSGLSAGALVKVITIQSDNNILVGGSFLSYGGNAVGNIVRLLPNGNADPGFNAGTGANGPVNAILVHPTEGKITIGGEFTLFNGTSQLRIVRLNPTGQRDTDFVEDNGADDAIYTFIWQESGQKILAGGDFVSYAGVGRNRITRILNGPSSPLPILLKSFTGKVIDNFIRLSWITEMEEQNEFFTIEKSLDLKRWEKIGKVDGAGNADYTRSYHLDDLHPVKGMQYYRLTQTDQNGKSVVFPRISVSYDAAGLKKVTIFPNPIVNGTVNLSLKETSVSNGVVRISNTSGQEVLVARNLNGSLISLDVQSLPKGIYFLELFAGQERLYAGRFMK